MTDLPFVGRQQELLRLESYLAAARAGRGQVCFVAGEPGAGKTALVREFARRSQAKQEDLLVVVGDCNAQTGPGEAFLPFREVLRLLTGDTPVNLNPGAITPEGAKRLEKFLSSSVQVLIATGPDLIAALVPGLTAAITAAKVGQAVLKQAGLDAKLTGLSRREPAKPGLPQPAITRENIFEQYTRFLIELAARKPLLIVLEDLQWIDVSSADLLFHLVRRIESSRVLIVGTYRPADVAADAETDPGAAAHALESVRSEIKRYLGDVTIDLDVRDAAAARRLVHELVDAEPNTLLSDFREALYQRTRGNPLFVLELLRDLRERGFLRQDAKGEWVAAPDLDWKALPARVEGVIERRVNRLDKELRKTLTVASVEGEEFTAEALARVTGASEREAVRQLSEVLSKQHRLVDAAGVTRVFAGRVSRYHFHHRLLRSYFYDRLDEAERSYLHEDVAKALEAMYAGQTDDIAVQLAWHFAEAGLDRKAAEYYRRAGELAAASYANAEAAAHLTRALDLTPEKELRPRFELLLARETVYDRQGRRTEQGQDLAAVTRLAAALKDAGAQAEASLREANFARLTGNYAAAANHAQVAAAQAEKAGNGLIEAQAYAVLGLVLRHQGNYAEAGEWLELALAQAQSLDEEALAAQITYWTGLNQYSSDQFDLARRNVLAARAWFEQRDDSMGQANCSLLLGAIASRQNDNGQAIAHMEEALAACRYAGWRSREALVLGDLANVRVNVGEYEAARADLLAALEITREVADREGEAVSLDTLGLIAQQLGGHDDALVLCKEALAIASEIGYRRGEAYALTHLGYSYLAVGDLEAARRSLTEAVTIRRSLASKAPTVVDDLAGLARVELEDGRPDKAFAYAAEALDRLREDGPEGVEFPVRDYLVCFKVLQATGSPEARRRAAEALEEGYALLERLAEQIKEPQLRTSFLTNVPFNRELRAAYRARIASARSSP